MLFCNDCVQGMSTKLDWNNLRYILEIARAGSLSAAATALGVNPTSVYRRLDNFEQQLGVRLFERLRNGYKLTPHGEALAETAKRIESEALAVERQVRGADLKLSGAIRVDTSELLGLYLLPPLLGAFADAFPEVQIDLSIDNRLIDLSRRDADVVIRATSNPPEHLVGRRVANVAFSAYAHRDYLDRTGRGRALAEYRWLGFEERLSNGVHARWLRKSLPATECQIRFASFAALREATCAAIGAAALPCFVAEGLDGLERLVEVERESGLGVWVLTHPDLRRNARIRAFTRDIGDRIASQSARLAGMTDAP